MTDTDWFRERFKENGHCQHCDKLAPPDNHGFVVHHIRYTPVMARVFICQKCHSNAHAFNKGYEVLWPLQRNHREARR